MNSEKVISNIKKAIKEHLDNNYAYDMLVDFELDVIDWNSLFEYIDKLQQENKQLKIQISAREEVCNRLESNWNKLKEYLNYKSERAVGEDEYVYDEIYNEIQELDQGSDSDE